MKNLNFYLTFQLFTMPSVMIRINKTAMQAIVLCILSFSFSNDFAQSAKPRFHVIAFFTARNDQAHISFVHEANQWFPKMAAKYDFTYDSTTNWSNLNAEYLSNYQVVLFLDTRPEAPAQREAFQKYMEQGGAWMDDAINRRRLDDTIQHPVAYMTCNLSAPAGGRPATFTHREVITL